MSIHGYRNSWLNVSVGVTPGGLQGPSPFTPSQPQAPLTPPIQMPPEFAELNRLRETANAAGNAAHLAWAQAVETHAGYQEALGLNAGAIKAWSMAGELADRILATTADAQQRASAQKASDEAKSALIILTRERERLAAESMQYAGGSGGLGFLALVAAAFYAAWRIWR